MSLTNKDVSQLITDQLVVLSQDVYQKHFTIIGATLFQKSKSPENYNLIILLSAEKENERTFFNAARSIKDHIAERNGIKCGLDNIQINYKHRGLFALSLDLTVDMNGKIQGAGIGVLERPAITVNTRDDGDHVEDITTTTFESVIDYGMFSINDLRMLELNAIHAISNSNNKENENDLMTKIIAMIGPK
jgi:hypothetical protein